MDYETIRYEVADGLATITLARPERLNALDARMVAELLDALDRVDGDDAVRALIVTGEGRAFCAGADLSRGAATFARRAEETPREIGGVLALRLFALLKPAIAAINGAAVGIGASLTLPMDVRLGGDGARFGFIFARRGMVPEAASAWFLPRLVGISRAVEWCCRGDLIDAREALEGGLLRAVHAPDALIPAARALAHAMTDASAPVSVALTRQMLWRGLGLTHPMEAHRIDSRGIAERGAQADATEGVAAFLEKRAATFPNRVSRDMPPFYPWWDEPEYE